MYSGSLGIYLEINFLFVIILISSLYFVSADELNIYENKQMGIKFRYPADWQLGLTIADQPTCQYHYCSQEFIRGDMSWVEKVDSGGFHVTMVPIKSAASNCSSLDEYVRCNYNTLIDQKGFIFIDDNQTFVAENPARLINYNISDIGSIPFLYAPGSFVVSEVYTRTNNAFYIFTFFGLGGYSILQEDFDTIMNSIEFLPLETKTPSFLK